MTERTVRTYRIDLGYDGTAFFGSQRQPGVRTVQGVLEAALSQIAAMPVTVALAGRTDRGVHAVGQVASCQLSWNRSSSDLARALSSVTPNDLGIAGVWEVEDGFHARFSARAREYRYRVWESNFPPLMVRQWVWHVRWPMDLGTMNAASRSLQGRRDFAAVAGAGVGVPESGVNTTRAIYRSCWREVPLEFEFESSAARLLEFRIVADAFLPHMVRNIVGDMIAVGRRQQSPEWFEALLRARDRRRGLPPAPPQGLVLWRVSYTDDEAGGSTRNDAGGATGVEGNEDVLTESVRN